MFLAIKNLYNLTTCNVKKYSNQLYLKNIFYQLSAFIFKTLIGILTNLYLARYLGPKDFGVLSYVTSFLIIISSVTNLGLDSIIVREFVINKCLNKINILIGTVFYLKFIFLRK